MKKNNLLVILFCFLTSLIILLFATKNSPLYAFNDWVDANAFFTVGKSMMHGLIPYKDIFEQKGPFLFLIYGIGYLISHKTFIGIFFIEVLLFTIALYFLHKTLKLFISTKTSLIIIPIFTALLTTTRAFTHGGSAEEICIAFFFITLYYFFRHFKDKEITQKEMFLNGIIAGLVLLIKYTFLGYWIGFTFAIFIDYLLKKDFKRAIIYPLTLLLGMFIPFTICLIYFAINHSLKEFFVNYFYINITAYSVEKMSLTDKLYKLTDGFINTLHTNPIHYYLLFSMIILIFSLNIKLRAKILYLIMIVMTIMGLFCGLKFYRYYVLFILFFSSIALLLIFKFFDKFINKIPNKLYILLFIVFSIFQIFYTYNHINYKNLIFKPKDYFNQYLYADIINEYDNPTLVNMGFLDWGLFTTADITPSTYFFHKLNFNYKYFPDNVDSFKKYIENKETTHILYISKLNKANLQINEPLLFENYSLIRYDKQKYEQKWFNVYLFKVKDS